MVGFQQLVQLEDYGPLVGAEVVHRIQRKAQQLQGLHVAHINSTYYGGGVAELLSSLTLLMNSVGIRTGWRVIQGAPDFFSITKKIHNALQGGAINLTDRKMQVYEQILYENSLRNHLDHDIIFVHDPQPLGMIHYYRKRVPWVWRCHVDLSNPDQALWQYMVPTIEKYDAVILSSPRYRQHLTTPQLIFRPAINPFSVTNRDLSEEEMAERLAHYEIPTDLPLVVQISRFDRWKDPEGVIKAFKIARRDVKARLVLLGNVATDDPEGQDVYQSLLRYRDDDVLILSQQDSALVNALQSTAAVVLQKSLQEGFGLTVTEAMWKEAVVIGGNVGGIKEQITDSDNGFLVSSVEEAARRIVQVVEDPNLRKTMGKKARNSVRKRFLMTRLLEQYIDLIDSFEISFKLAKPVESFYE